ncbi:hypothetical protein WK78_03130 [Burkholderia cepacia]|uniref:DUF1778 domain-containing protein n=1 Tax=Burkholderia savannae TaxID=1637837 RepID=A0ABR5T8K9_9BURK|nr:MULTISPECIES: DUF1778 domain-containing protein [Burkholderia]AOJ79239.1 hypothetical protein WS86_00320 [Burkholderia savannae]KVV25126.1 hypothetical protein WK78_03130 [Burkholderia cepacia]KWZ39592.1 hypothetical protein WS72_19265 [Burkholderia savannae]
MARFEARVEPELHAMVKRAAEIQNRSLSDFIVSAARDAAQRAIEEAEILRLSMADQQRFVDALLSPPEPNDALKRAMARHEELVRHE